MRLFPLALLLGTISTSFAEVSIRDTTVLGIPYIRFLAGPGNPGNLKIAEERGVLRASLEGSSDSVLVIFDRNPFAQMSGRTRPLVLPPRVTKSRLVLPKATSLSILQHLGLSLGKPPEKSDSIARESSPPSATKPSVTDSSGNAAQASPSPPTARPPEPTTIPPSGPIPPLAPDVIDPPTPVTVPSPEKLASTPPEDSESSSSANHPEKKGLFTVVIDAGHGGKDPGAMGKDADGESFQEKMATLEVARRLRDELSHYKGIKVVMTRDKDVFLELAERTRISNAVKGDLFVSLHCNSLPTNSKHRDEVNGFMVYLLREAKDANDRAIERRENEAIRYETGERAKKQSLDPVEWMMLEHQLNLYTKESERLAGQVVKNLSKEGTVAKERTGAGQAGFFVLVGALMPSVLIEMGYLSNTHDIGALSDPAKQKRIAFEIAKSIDEFRRTKR